jgi:hypothetical protein
VKEDLDDILQHWGIAGMKWKKHKNKPDDEKERVLNNFKASIKNLIKTVKAMKKKNKPSADKAKPKKIVKKKKVSHNKEKAKKKLKELLKKHKTKKAKGKKGSKRGKSGSGGKGKKGSSSSGSSGNSKVASLTKEQELDKKLKDLFSDHDAMGRVIPKAASTRIAGLRSRDLEKKVKAAINTKVKKRKSKS